MFFCCFLSDIIYLVKLRTSFILKYTRNNSSWSTADAWQFAVQASVWFFLFLWEMWTMRHPGNTTIRFTSQLTLTLMHDIHMHLSDSIWKALKACQAHLTPLSGRTTAARQLVEISQKSFRLKPHWTKDDSQCGGVIKRDNIYVTHELCEKSWAWKKSCCCIRECLNGC